MISPFNFELQQPDRSLVQPALQNIILGYLEPLQVFQLDVDGGPQRRRAYHPVEAEIAIFDRLEAPRRCPPAITASSIIGGLRLPARRSRAGLFSLFYLVEIRN